MMAVFLGKYSYPRLILLLMACAVVTSAINVQDTMLTWLLEAFPVLVAIVLLVLTMRRFRLTNLLYTLILIHACVLLYGAHYSYAGTPLGDWLGEVMGWQRNNFDKLGHFMQGFCPVMCAREVIARCTPIRRGGWLATLSFTVAMTVSALYEIVEWLASLSAPDDTEAFLGTQGYIWDTQTDMAMCLVGAVVALVLLSHLHNRQLDQFR